MQFIAHGKLVQLVIESDLWGAKVVAVYVGGEYIGGYDMYNIEDVRSYIELDEGFLHEAYA